MLPRLSAVVPKIALMMIPAAAFATLVPALSLEKLTDVAETIVSGRVVRSWTAWDSSHRYIWTHYELAVSATHKGARAERVVVSEPGGVVGNDAMVIAGASSYAAGEEVIVFLERMPNGYLRTAGWTQGKYTVDSAGVSAAAFRARIEAYMRSRAGVRQ